MEQLRGITKRIDVTKLEALAKAKGTSLYEIAKKRKIKRSSIYAWAKEPGRFQLSVLEKIAPDLGLTASELVAFLTESEE